MATLRHENITPPGGYKYVQPDTHVWFESDNMETLLGMVIRHREHKLLDVANAQRDIERQMCAGLGDEWCRAEPGEVRNPVRDLTSELTTEMAKSLGKAVLAFLGSGAGFVDAGVAHARSEICRGCPFNKPAKLCSCSSVYKLVESMIPSARHQPGVSVCMACGCSLQAKVNLPLEVVRASLAPGTVLPGWCWQNVPPATP